MFKRVLVVCVLFGSVLWVGSCAQLKMESSRDLLADGLVGWQQVGGQPGGWGLEDGILYTKGGHGGWLATVREYGDFRLELEFKVPPGGNSGVFIRAPLEGDPAYTGMEIQILDDFTDKYGKLRPEQFTGSIYDVQAPSERVSKKANEWQKMVIVCRGPKVQITLNGTRIVDTSVEYYPHKYGRHPGLKRTRGYIGLQDHGSRLDFRNIRISEL